MSPQNPNQPQEQPTLKLTSTEDYRDGYANSVQVRMSVWDFFLVFGTMTQQNPEELTVRNFQGIYLSPQQAKALFNVLGQNLAQYEQAFGSISLEPVPSTSAQRPLN
jgi:flagellar protein FlaG